MATRIAPPRRRRPSGASTSRRAVLRRRLGLLAAGAVLVVLGLLALQPLFGKAVQEIALPLRHEDVIRQQAADKNLDPALIAAVIYVESRFRDQTSAAGAKGLMQILPETAEYIAELSGGTEFQRGDLASPQINIAYGSYYLRYLLDKYGSEPLAVAAYNGGEGRLDEWLEDARARGGSLEIPYRETRDYVRRVGEAKAAYRREYPDELGLS